MATSGGSALSGMRLAWEPGKTQKKQTEGSEIDDTEAGKKMSDCIQRLYIPSDFQLGPIWAIMEERNKDVLSKGGGVRRKKYERKATWSCIEQNKARGEGYKEEQEKDESQPWGPSVRKRGL